MILALRGYPSARIPPQRQDHRMKEERAAEPLRPPPFSRRRSGAVLGGAEREARRLSCRGRVRRRRMGRMDVQSVTVGLPVGDLDGAVEWYRNVFGLSGPDLAPADGVVEFRIGSVWLQLGEEPIERSGAEVVTRFGVRDA